MSRYSKLLVILSISLCAATCQGKKADLLIQFSLAGDFKSIDKLLGEGVDINQRNADGYTALYKVVETGTVDSAHELIKRGADVNLATHHGTILHTAVMRGECNIVKVLLESGANAHALDAATETPLHLAASRDNREITTLLIKYGANIDYQNHYGKFPLQLAAFEGNMDIVELLLANGADLSLKDKWGANLLISSVGSGSLEMVKLFVELGIDVNDASFLGTTPIHPASYYGYIDIMEYL
ncbi:MAG: ankyrin repeat domain-containing protein, partial [Spirochaetaceae bacterium]